MKPVRTAHDGSPRGVLSVLNATEEAALCRHWHEHHDVGAAEQPIGSHLYLLAGTAMAHRGQWGLAQDLIGESHYGLTRAICRYDPACGTRFTTHATWWARTAIRNALRHARTRPAMTNHFAVAMPPLPPRDPTPCASIQFVL
jgi:DNA-directed RNA polymerase sigma subunit (sigma70/sigma32)